MFNGYDAKRLCVLFAKLVRSNSVVCDGKLFYGPDRVLFVNRCSTVGHRFTEVGYLPGLTSFFMTTRFVRLPAQVVYLTSQGMHVMHISLDSRSNLRLRLRSYTIKRRAHG